MQCSRNIILLFPAIGLHLDNLVSEGFSHLRMAHLLSKSMITEQLSIKLFKSNDL